MPDPILALLAFSAGALFGGFIVALGASAAKPTPRPMSDRADR